jgi:hypothetical protein
MRAHLGLKDADDLKRKYASEYVERLLGLCERIASYRIPVYFVDLDDERAPLRGPPRSSSLPTGLARG